MAIFFGTLVKEKKLLKALYRFIKFEACFNGIFFGNFFIENNGLSGLFYSSPKSNNLMVKRKDE